jgi:dTDP-4-dehydrorhamnose reductase
MRQNGFKVTTTTRRQVNLHKHSLYLDLGDERSFRNILSSTFDTVVICTGITSIRECEENPQATHAINVSAVLEIARYVALRSNFCVYLSTSLVFDGKSILPKIEDDTNPLTEYGRQKAEVERHLIKMSGNWSIIRLTKILESIGPLLTNWHKDLSDNNAIYPFSNKYIAPISLDFTVSTISRIIQLKRRGVTQVSSVNDISYEDVARYIAYAFGFSSHLIVPYDFRMDQFEQGPNTALDTGSLLELGIRTPSPHRAINVIVKQITQYSTS